MDEDLDMLEEAINHLMRSYKRPRYWEATKRLARVDIDRPSAYLLMMTSDSSSGCMLNELATKLGVEAPSVTRIVQRLEQDNLITRTANPADRRSIQIRPTREGQAIVRRLQRAKREQLRLLLSSWSKGDRKQLAQLLHRLAVQAADADGAPRETK